MKPHLVIFEPFKPTPITSGGQYRIYHTLKILSQNFNTKLTYFSETTKNNFSYIKTGIPFWFSSWSQKPSKIPQSQNYLVEFTQLLYIINFLPKSSKKIFVAHDISTVSYWRRLTEVNYFKKIIHFLRLIEVYLYEKKYLPKYDYVIAVSENDAHLLKKIFKLKNIIVCPNGIAQINILPLSTNPPLKIGFIGRTSHPPNKFAIDFLINKIIPELEHQNINYQVIILSDIKVNIPKVTCLSSITDVSLFYQQIDILVAPIYSGSGSRIKILESLSFGRPVITTKIGAEGIDIPSIYLNIVKDNRPQTWIKQILNSQRSITSDDTLSLKKLLRNFLWFKTLQPLVKIISH